MNKRTLAIARAVAVIGGTSALIAGATFAAGNVGTVSLTGNTFAAIQGLQISNGGAYGDSATGFSFGTVAQASNTPQGVQNFYLEDVTSGATPLGVSFACANYGGFDGLDTSKVMVNIRRDDQTQVDSAPLSTLCTGTPASFSSVNDPSTGGVGTKYDVWVSLAPGAINGALNGASDKFDLTFTGQD